MIDLKLLCEKHFEKIKEVRHYIHMNPELGFCEYKTSSLIQKELQKLNIDYKVIAKTGVVALIKGKYEGKTILLRSDMDALKIEEMVDIPFKSCVKGLMHACGHDGHVASLLGVAMILSELKEYLHGNVKLMFQPAEEDEGGAETMIKEGVLENPKVDIAIGGHLWGEVESGKVLMKKGAFMAAPDLFTFKIIGKGGHGALPHLALDPIPIACTIINEIQTIVSRKSSPFNPIVVSVCKIQGGHSHNVIPNEVEVMGTIRTLDEETRLWVPSIMENIIKGITLGEGANYIFDYKGRYPVLMNNEKVTEFSKLSIEKIINKENVSYSEFPTMGGEDFAYIAQKVPSTFFFVGIAKDENNPVIHHNPKFYFNDVDMKVLILALAQIALDYLKE